MVGLGAESADAPNILWIFCDELRADALGCYGNPYTSIKTPNIDGLANEGVRFDRYYVNSPVCVPSRTAIKTGQYPEQTGVYHNEGLFTYAPEKPAPVFTHSLEAHGYTTVNFGKCHVPELLRPFQFDYPEGSDQFGLQAAVRQADPAETLVVRGPNGLGIIASRFPNRDPYPPSAVTDHALEWMRQQDGTAPYLCRVSYLQPHTPVAAPDPWATMYDPRDFPDSVTVPTTLSRFERRYGEICGGEGLGPQNLQWIHACYYGLVAWIDDQVGRLLEGLRRSNSTRPTVVVFTSDHGVNLGEHGALGKQLFTPQCHRVPLIVHWPGAVPRGTARSDMCQGIDLATTFSAMAGVPTPPMAAGRDLLTERGAEPSFATIGYGDAGSTAMPMLALGTYEDDRGWPRRACVRRGTLRLDRNVRIDGHSISADDADSDMFVADSQADPAEVLNFVSDPTYAAVVKELSELLDDHIGGAYEPDLGDFYAQWASSALQLRH